MTARLDESALVSFLVDHGAERIAHPGGTLLAHLRRTAERLALWEARPALVAAGFAHAAYGTDGFRRALIEPTDRAVLIRLIGDEAEAIVYAYGASDRAFADIADATLRNRFTRELVAPPPALSRDLIELTCANELDIWIQCDSIADRAELAALLRRYAGRASDAAARGIDEVFRTPSSPIG